MITIIAELKRSVVYKMLKKVLLNYKSALEEFEVNTLDKVNFLQNKLKEADMYIMVQHKRLEQFDKFRVSDESRDLVQILSK